MKINLKMLHGWGACLEGRKWFGLKYGNKTKMV